MPFLPPNQQCQSTTVPKLIGTPVRSFTYAKQTNNWTEHKTAWASDKQHKLTIMQSISYSDILQVKTHWEGAEGNFTF